MSGNQPEMPVVSEVIMAADPKFIADAEFLLLAINMRLIVFDSFKLFVQDLIAEVSHEEAHNESNDGSYKHLWVPGLIHVYFWFGTAE